MFLLRVAEAAKSCYKVRSVYQTVRGYPINVLHYRLNTKESRNSKFSGNGILIQTVVNESLQIVYCPCRMKYNFNVY